MLRQPFNRIRAPALLLAILFVATLPVSSASTLSSDNPEQHPNSDQNSQSADQFKWDGHYWWDNENHWRWEGCYQWEDGQHWKWDGQRWWNGKKWWDGSKWRD